ncbi:pseudaminic acid cytidylyltransferase [Magnetovirga frankeli]|uniref:pseudaminic acid cytidylyltransferase n=1 Tax=Magnetovirga frankeli TaxID=947516 RepID=UPI001292CDC9|nr:pseudaminic acid cytidylyltransferase [gamma proteobacterium SS-5]
MTSIAIIPARGGSKRIPRKNIKDFLGRPMIGYPIEAARLSGLFGRIIVSTDDAEIAHIARQQGAETPFTRPAELADDQAGTTPVVRHAINWLLEQGEAPELVCCIYATTPLLTSEYLVQGWQALQDRPEKDFAFSVTSFPYPFQRGLKLTTEGGVAPFFPEFIPCRSQDLEPAYHDAGQFYWGRTQAWLGDGGMFSDRARPVILPRFRVQDIDDEEDWQRAQMLYRAIHSTP